MPRLALPVATIAALVLGSCLVARSADGARWSAAILLAEPLIAVGLVGAAYAARALSHRALAGAILLGWVLAAAGARLPLGAGDEPRLPPFYGQEVGGCAGGLSLPTRDVEVLAWSAADVDAATAVDALASERADIVVAYARDPAALAEDLQARRGGESILPSPGGPVLWTAGAFHLCGSGTAWAEGDAGDGVALAFAGVDDALTLPIVAGSVPRLLSAGWDLAAAGARGRIGGMLDALQSSLAVAIVDGAGARTWSRLRAGVRRAGLEVAPGPPTWPARVLGLPALPLHPSTAAFYGPAWRLGEIARVRMPAGNVDAIRLRLEPKAVRTRR